MEDREQVRSAPSVAYEYMLDGKTFCGKRISLAEVIPEGEIETIPNRYPMGASVTVYYDPANPCQAVLERDLPADFGKGLAGVFGFIGGGVILALLILAKAPQMLAPHLPSPKNALFVTLSAGLGVFLLLLGFAQQREILAAQTWPSASGPVLISEVHSFRQWKLNLSSAPKRLDGLLFGFIGGSSQQPIASAIARPPAPGRTGPA